MDALFEIPIRHASHLLPFTFPTSAHSSWHLTSILDRITQILWVLVTQSCWTLCDPMDCSPPGSSVCGILQARILEWVAIPFSKGSSWPRDWTRVSCIGRQILYCLSHPPSKSSCSLSSPHGIMDCSSFLQKKTKTQREVTCPRSWGKCMRELNQNSDLLTPTDFIP